jgi:hypothetical protein
MTPPVNAGQHRLLITARNPDSLHALVKPAAESARTVCQAACRVKGASFRTPFTTSSQRGSGKVFRFNKDHQGLGEYTVVLHFVIRFPALEGVHDGVEVRNVHE